MNTQQMHAAIIDISKRPVDTGCLLSEAFTELIMAELGPTLVVTQTATL